MSYWDAHERLEAQQAEHALSAHGGCLPAAVVLHRGLLGPLGDQVSQQAQDQLAGGFAAAGSLQDVEQTEALTLRSC